jgi:hypothetical protein
MSVEGLKSAEAIADELCTRLRGISVAAGYETDIGLREFRGRRSVSPDLVPCFVLIELDDIVTDRLGRLPEYLIEQHYWVLAYAECDPDRPNTTAHKMLRDMKRALFTTGGQPDAKLNGGVRRLSYQGRDIGPRADGSNTVVAAIQISAEFVEILSSP